MIGSDSCVSVPVIINGQSYDPVRYGDEERWQSERKRCHDCSVIKGGYHHPGCDVEECPVCHGQIISCGCLDEGDE